MNMNDVVTQSEEKGDHLYRVSWIEHVVGIGAPKSSEIDHGTEDIARSKELADRNQIALNTTVGRRVRSNLKDPHKNVYSVASKESVTIPEATKARRSVWTQAQYKLLKGIAPTEPTTMDGSAFAARGKLRTLLGDAFLEEIRGKTVIDFGCGEGIEAVEMAAAGAERVIGLDIQTTLLEKARARAKQAGVEQKCSFTTETTEPADIITSIDAFEHFSEPKLALDAMYRLLRPGGTLVASFGPTWYHPLGGHLFSVFPWAHLIFSEDALIAWRSDFKTDGATKFHETAGGLNRMTIRHFERLAAESAFEVQTIEPVPIRKLKHVHWKWTREWTSAIVRARLRKTQ
jgi:2-polyprenyl-3-methyl-5-hydroxy-6-metoxy-1,4-benzoquinol methylase